MLHGTDGGKKVDKDIRENNGSCHGMMRVHTAKGSFTIGRRSSGIYTVNRKNTPKCFIISSTKPSRFWKKLVHTVLN